MFSTKSEILSVLGAVVVGLVLLYYIPVGTLSDLISPVPQVDMTGWKTYTNAKFGVSVEYPPEFFVKPGQTGPLAEWHLYGVLNGSEIASVNVARSFEPKTNFGDATLRAGVSSDSTAVTQCLNPPKDLGYQPTYDQRLIGGIAFHKFIHDEAGAGNFYEFTSYRAVRNNTCQVFEYVIHYSNLDNYPATSGIKAYDKQKVLSTLEGILTSVTFTK